MRPHQPNNTKRARCAFLLLDDVCSVCVFGELVCRHAKRVINSTSRRASLVSLPFYYTRRREKNEKKNIHTHLRRSNAFTHSMGINCWLHNQHNDEHSLYVAVVAAAAVCIIAAARARNSHARWRSYMRLQCAERSSHGACAISARKHANAY